MTTTTCSPARSPSKPNSRQRPEMPHRLRTRWRSRSWSSTIRRQRRPESRHSAGISVVELTWDANVEPDFASYSVYRSTTPGTGTGGALVASGLTSPAFTDDDAALVNGTEYFYSIVAIDGAAQASDVSEVSATPQATFRINAGGAEVAAIDAGPAWEADGTGANQHRFLAFLGSDNSSSGNATPDASVSADVPPVVFIAERWSNADFGYEVPALNGELLTVRVFLASDFGDTSPPPRVFDVEIDGVVVIDDISLVTLPYVHNKGYEFSFAVTSDGTVDIDFIKGVADNPLVNAIEVTLAL